MPRLGTIMDTDILSSLAFSRLERTLSTCQSTFLAGSRVNSLAAGPVETTIGNDWEPLGQSEWRTSYELSRYRSVFG